MRGLSLKQHNLLRKRKMVMAGARGGHLCFAKEVMIKGQSDYLCISADPLCPLSTFFFYFPPNAEYKVTDLEHINWKASFICLQRKTVWQKPHSQKAKRLWGFCQKGKGAVWGGEWMAKGQRGGTALGPGNRLAVTCLQKSTRGVIQTKSLQSCSDISIEAHERKPVTLHPLFPLPPASHHAPSSYPPTLTRPSMLLVLTCCEVITTCCLWNSSPQIPAKSIRV